MGTSSGEHSSCWKNAACLIPAGLGTVDSRKLCHHAELHSEEGQCCTRGIFHPKTWATRSNGWNPQNAPEWRGDPVPVTTPEAQCVAVLLVTNTEGLGKVIWVTQVSRGPLLGHLMARGDFDLPRRAEILKLAVTVLPSNLPLKGVSIQHFLFSPSLGPDWTR